MTNIYSLFEYIMFDESINNKKKKDACLIGYINETNE